MTVAGLVVLAVGALFFDLDVGFSAFVLAVLLSAVDPAGAKGAVSQIAWSTVLLVCGIVTYVSLMQTLGTIDYLGGSVAAIGAAVGALAICYIGGIVSAFASTTGILGALIPLAVPFLQRQDLSTIGLVTALGFSASAVDSSPFSTSGSLIVANARKEIASSSTAGFSNGGPRWSCWHRSPRGCSWSCRVGYDRGRDAGGTCPAALDGVRVLEVGVFMAAPFAAMQLADLGADVLKIESLDGEPVRASGPFVNGESSPFLRLNRDKRSVALDLKSPEGKRAFLRLAATRTWSSRTSAPARCARSARRTTTCAPSTRGSSTPRRRGSARTARSPIGRGSTSWRRRAAG